MKGDYYGSFNNVISSIFMLALGFIARVKGWITLEQKNGANAIIFKILFPILVLNLMCTATIETDHIKIIGYVLVFTF